MVFIAHMAISQHAYLYFFNYNKLCGLVFAGISRFPSNARTLLREMHHFVRYYACNFSNALCCNLKQRLKELIPFANTPCHIAASLSTC